MATWHHDVDDVGIWVLNDPGSLVQEEDKRKIVCVWMIILRDQMILYRYRQKIIMLFLLLVLTQYFRKCNMQQKWWFLLSVPLTAVNEHRNFNFISYKLWYTSYIHYYTQFQFLFVHLARSFSFHLILGAWRIISY